MNKKKMRNSYFFILLFLCCFFTGPHSFASNTGRFDLSSPQNFFPHIIFVQPGCRTPPASQLSIPQELPSKPQAVVKRGVFVSINGRLYNIAGDTNICDLPSDEQGEDCFALLEAIKLSTSMVDRIVKAGYGAFIGVQKAPLINLLLRLIYADIPLEEQNSFREYLNGPKNKAIQEALNLASSSESLKSCWSGCISELLSIMEDFGNQGDSRDLEHFDRKERFEDGGKKFLLSCIYFGNNDYVYELLRISWFWFLNLDFLQEIIENHALFNYGDASVSNKEVALKKVKAIYNKLGQINFGVLNGARFQKFPNKKEIEDIVKKISLRKNGFATILKVYTKLEQPGRLVKLYLYIVNKDCDSEEMKGMLFGAFVHGLFAKKFECLEFLSDKLKGLTQGKASGQIQKIINIFACSNNIRGCPEWIREQLYPDQRDIESTQGPEEDSGKEEERLSFMSIETDSEFGMPQSPYGGG